MTGKINIGKFDKMDQLKSLKKSSREFYLEVGIISHSVHKSKKNYNRKNKHKNNLSNLKLN